MTVLVVAEPQDKAEKIAMTVPVGIEPQRGGHSHGGRSAGASTSSCPANTPSPFLPKPLNPDVGLREIPARPIPSFTRASTAKTRCRKTDQLLAWLQAQDIATIGQPQLARYNPPWTFTLPRRNEIQQEIQWNKP